VFATKLARKEGRHRTARAIGWIWVETKAEMRTGFTESVLGELLADGAIAHSDAVIAVCAGERERDLFLHFGFQDVTITNIDEAETGDRFPPFNWSHQDAQDLEFEDDSFDFAFVADGLHHCSSPHRAMLEMYRVAKKGIIVVESRNNLLMRTANRFGLSPEYEVEAVVCNKCERGGVDNTEIPNYIYRWTESDFTKAIRSFNPLGKHIFRFFYGLNLPYEAAGWTKSRLKLYVIRAADPLLRGFTRIFRKQCNTMAMIALKPRIPEDLWPWLKLQNGRVLLNPEYAGRRFKLDEIFRTYHGRSHSD
jgi:ubiquinone/menaquinone biosynthesis C-methylase UbiE